MGIIKATIDAIGGGLADQWLEVIEADEMSGNTVFTKGVAVRRGKRNSNKRGSEDVISDGSVIHVYPNQFMILVDGGKIVDFTAEEGYYKVDNKAAPSLFSGSFGASIKESFNRIRYGGVPSHAQKAFFINLQEIKGIRFGTRAPVNYFDMFYNSELFLRAHGTYSIKITDPIRFYTEVVDKNADRVEIDTINEQYLNEFLEGLQVAINRMSADGIRISYVASKASEVSRYMAEELDDKWKELRGFEVLSDGIASDSYDEESRKLINMRNQGAMMGDAAVREGFVQSSIARGIESAGSNPAGAGTAFMGMGFGMNAAGGFMASASETNREQMRNQQANSNANGWTCTCGQVNTGKFCGACGKKQPGGEAEGWTCSCGAKNTGKFCGECGSPKPAEKKSWFCTECGAENTGRFCGECGSPKP